MSEPPSFTPMAPDDLPDVKALWADTEGITLRAVDSVEALQRFLDRNPGLSWVARAGDGAAANGAAANGAAANGVAANGVAANGVAANGVAANVLAANVLAANSVVGAVLCGHDGRRGYIHHLAVRRAARHRGIGRELVRRALDGLERIGIVKCHLFVRGDNAAALRFWQHLDWELRQDIRILSHLRSADPGA
jgi:ribosomal protein S18 acetylase RimI-like enzyme